MVNIAGVICNDAEFQRALENEQMSRYEKTLLFDEVVNGIEINNLYDMGGIKITCFDADNNVYANWGTNYNNYQFLFDSRGCRTALGRMAMCSGICSRRPMCWRKTEIPIMFRLPNL